MVDGTGYPLSNQAVTLLANKQYGESNATFTIGNRAVSNSTSNSDGLDVAGTTDSFGDISFVVTDTTQGVAEPSSIDTSAVDPLNGQVGAFYGQFGLRIGSTPQLQQSMDIVEVHIIGNLINPFLVNHNLNKGLLLWSQEFNDSATTFTDNSEWTHLIGDGYNQLGFSNYGTGEVESNSIEATQIDGNGNLVINTMKANGAWTSARLWTQGKLNFQYGQLEARIQLPVGSFNWPAFWMLGSSYLFPNGRSGSVPWPNSGEIDIAEGLGHNSSLQSTLHGNNPGTTSPWNGGGGLTSFAPLQNLSAEPHVFGVLWIPNSIAFTLDGYIFVINSFANGVITQETPSGRTTFDSGGVWPFNSPFFLILDNAIPGNVESLPDGSSSSMKVDWIRYYSYQDQGSVTR